MSNKRVPDLDPASPISPDDYFLVVQDDQYKKVSAATIISTIRGDSAVLGTLDSRWCSFKAAGGSNARNLTEHPRKYEIAVHFDDSDIDTGSFTNRIMTGLVIIPRGVFTVRAWCSCNMQIARDGANVKIHKNDEIVASNRVFSSKSTGGSGPVTQYNTGWVFSHPINVVEGDILSVSVWIEQDASAKNYGVYSYSTFFCVSAIEGS